MENIFATPEEIKEHSQREDSIWLSLEAGKNQKTTIIDWEDINVLELILDRDEPDALIVTGIPLYGDAGDAEDILLIATRYVFNLIEIREKIKENKELLEGIGTNES